LDEPNSDLAILPNINDDSPQNCDWRNRRAKGRAALKTAI